MAESSIVGTRIRERRVQMRIRQADLAEAAGISASYMNLIEHNRRRIGGKLLNRLADVLDVEAALLADGAEATLVAGLNEAAAGRAASMARAEEFAGRFPDWADLALTLYQQNTALEQSVRTLTDRLSHDPHLAASLHDVITTVTAIRSTASILADTRELEPEWQGRFHRNINEDSRRLADSAQSLVRYLEAAPDTQADVKSPQDELDVFLGDHGYHFEALERGADSAAIDVILKASGSLVSEPARALARDVLVQYAKDAAALPLKELRAAMAFAGAEPEALAKRLGLPIPLVFRRLAALPEQEIGPIGLTICDGSGALIFRKPLPEFSLPSVGGACAIWPLFQALTQPQTPVEAVLRQGGMDTQPVRALAAVDPVSQPSFHAPALMHAHMLLLPISGPPPSEQAARDVGTTCRVCPIGDCAARREPSIIAQGF